MTAEGLETKLFPELYCYISYSMLSPNVKPSFSYLTKELQKFDLIEAILILSKLNLLMSEEKYAIDKNFQYRLYDLFLNNYYKNKFIYFIKREGRKDKFFLFHRHQLLFLLKNVFLICNRVPNFSFQNRKERERLGKCCLLTNDFLTIFKDRKSSGNDNLEKIKENLWKELLPSYEINLIPDLMFDIGRMRIIFNKIIHQLNKDNLFVDINKKFEEITRFSINEYMFLVFAVIALCFQRRKEIIDNPNAIVIDENSFTRNSVISSGQIVNLLNFISLPLKQFKDVIYSSRDLEYNYGFLPFKKYPLARISENKYIPLDINFILEKISNGIFWIINDGLPREERSQFHTFWGKLFETYFIYLFKEVGLLQKGLFISKPCFDGTNHEVADGILNHGEDLILFECKFTILTQESRYSSSTEELIKEIRTKFERNKSGEWKGYGQLANSIIKLFSSGNKWMCRYIDKKKVKRVFPVLVTYENILNAPFTNYFLNKYFQTLLNNSSFENKVDIKPLIIISIGDLEASQPFFNNFPRLLEERLRFDPELDVSFSDFLKRKYRDNNLLSPKLIKDEYEQFFIEIRKAIFGKS